MVVEEGRQLSLGIDPETDDLDFEVAQPDRMELLLVPVDKLIPNEYNDFEVDKNNTDMMDSIEAVDLRQPLDVVPVAGGFYKILGGESRYWGIMKGIEDGITWFSGYKLRGIPCVFNPCRKPIDALDEQIIITESNIRNRDLHSSYMKHIQKLFYLYEEKKKKNPYFKGLKGNVVNNLAKKLGISDRQVYKYLSIAKDGDEWIKKAIAEGRLSAEMANAIVHMPEEDQSELKAFFEENGRITDEELAKHRKSHKERKDNDVQMNLFDVTGSGGEPDFGDLGLPDEFDGDSIGVNNGNTTGSPINLMDFADDDSRYGIDSEFGEESENDEFHENYEESDGYHDMEEPDNSDKSSSIGNVLSNDVKAQMMSDSLSWFWDMGKRGTMTSDEQIYVNNIVKLLAKFYFPSFSEKGFIDDDMKDICKQIVDTISPLL